VTETLIGAALVALIYWGYWSFYASGRYPTKRTPQTLEDFRPGPDRSGNLPHGEEDTTGNGG